MDSGVHVLLFPSPRQGLINPMLHFATALVDSGIHVTFLHTEHNLRRITRAPPPRLRLLSVPDGLPDDHPRAFMELMESMCTLLGKGLAVRLPKKATMIKCATTTFGAPQTVGHCYRELADLDCGAISKW
ncbi:hypothetical protein QYE76_040528 [Lolium multiflorum]|uniref:Uncharacterized protein n=1 Tax=Lolium multiflorum TaxID=4521 RepID=A0AAD8WT66_LOLMU|nr:hypothetical protein QYE76_040528 [Lolium multiflorum]